MTRNRPLAFGFRQTFPSDPLRFCDSPSGNQQLRATHSRRNQIVVFSIAFINIRTEPSVLPVSLTPRRCPLSTRSRANTDNRPNSIRRVLSPWSDRPNLVRGSLGQPSAVIPRALSTSSCTTLIAAILPATACDGPRPGSPRRAPAEPLAPRRCAPGPRPGAGEY